MCISAINVKVSDFGEFTINANMDSTIYINHESKRNPEDVSAYRMNYQKIMKDNPERKFYCLSLLTPKMEEQFGIKVHYDREALYNAIHKATYRTGKSNYDSMCSD